MQQIEQTGSKLGNAKVALLLVLLSMGCALLLWFRPYVSDEVRFLFMLWNLFLAWIPYAAAVTAVTIQRKGALPAAARLTLSAALGVLWLLFLPNAAYLTTDLIHLIAGWHFYLEQGKFTSYLVWYDIVLFSLLSWCGIILGFLSTYQFHRLVAQSKGELAGWAFTAAVTVLGGYGVFLGRIVRLNSWDALVRPVDLIGEVLGNLHWRGLAFSMLFSIFIGVTYLFLYHLQERKA